MQFEYFIVVAHMVTNTSFAFFYIQDFEEVCYEGDNRDLWWLPEDKAWIVPLKDGGLLRTPPTKKLKIMNVLANSTILSDTLLYFKYFSLYSSLF